MYIYLRYSFSLVKRYIFHLSNVTSFTILKCRTISKSKLKMKSLINMAIQIWMCLCVHLQMHQYSIWSKCFYLYCFMFGRFCYSNFENSLNNTKGSPTILLFPVHDSLPTPLLLIHLCRVLLYFTRMCIYNIFLFAAKSYLFTRQSMAWLSKSLQSNQPWWRWDEKTFFLA